MARLRIRADDWIPVEKAKVRPGDPVLWCNRMRAMVSMEWKPILADKALKFPATHVIPIELPYKTVRDETQNDEIQVREVERSIARAKARRR